MRRKISLPPAVIPLTLFLTVQLSLSGCGLPAEKQASQAAGTPGVSAAEGDKSGSKSLVCLRAAEPVEIDGIIETAWRQARTLRLDDPAEIADPNRVKIYTLWDPDYLYVAYYVEDKYLVGFQTERDHKALYKDDMIEVLIDPRRDATDQWLEDDIVYHVNILGRVKDDRGTPEGVSDATWNSLAKFAASYQGTLNDSTDTDTGFSVELAVPWSEIGKTPAPGVTVGIDFAAGDAEGPEEHLWDWCGAHPFRQPTVYGVLQLQ